MAKGRTAQRARTDKGKRGKGKRKDNLKKDKSQVKCFSCWKFGHHSNKCPDERSADVF